MIAHRHRQHRTVKGQRAGVIGDEQAGAGVREIFNAADIDPDPLVVEEAQRRQHHGVVVLRIEAELIDRVVAGDALAEEVGNPGDAPR